MEAALAPTHNAGVLKVRDEIRDISTTPALPTAFMNARSATNTGGFRGLLALCLTQPQ